MPAAWTATPASTLQSLRLTTYNWQAIFFLLNDNTHAVLELPQLLTAADNHCSSMPAVLGLKHLQTHHVVERRESSRIHVDPATGLQEG
jgi:hypothetical protein